MKLNWELHEVSGDLKEKSNSTFVRGQDLPDFWMSRSQHPATLCSSRINSLLLVTGETALPLFCCFLWKYQAYYSRGHAERSNRKPESMETHRTDLIPIWTRFISSPLKVSIPPQITAQEQFSLERIEVQSHAGDFWLCFEDWSHWSRSLIQEWLKINPAVFMSRVLFSFTGMTD